MIHFFEGFLLQASLILVLGAQNIFILESGFKKQKQYTAALVCALCDVLLVFIGVAGVASIFIKHPYMKLFIGSVGLIFFVLLWVVEVQRGVKL